MLRRIVLVLSTLFLSLFILSLSILKSTLAFDVDYSLAPSGRILPGNPLWFLLAAKDKIQVFLIQDPTKRGEMKLFYADTRLSASQTLFEEGKIEIGLATLTKAEKYLEEASYEDTSPEFLTKLSQASLKHRQVAEEILQNSPEAVRPKINQIGDYSKNVYKNTRDTLFSKGFQAPESPFHD